MKRCSDCRAEHERTCSYCIVCSRIRNSRYRKIKRDRNRKIGVCITCQDEAELFEWAGTLKCRECRKKERKVYYLRHVGRNKDFVKVFKLDKPCFDCGVLYPPYVMDFDHRRPEQKIKSISDMCAQGMSLEVISREISKCDLVCSNCHRERTHGER